MVTITRHVFINIFQMEHFSAVKFVMDYEKNMSFLVVAKSPKIFEKSWKDRTQGFFKSSVISFLYKKMAEFAVLDCCITEYMCSQISSH